MFVAKFKRHILISRKRAIAYFSVFDSLIALATLLVYMVIIWKKDLFPLVRDMILLKEPFALFSVAWVVGLVAWRSGVHIQKLLNGDKRTTALMFLEGFLGGSFLLIVYEFVYYIPFLLTKLGIPVKYQSKILLTSGWRDYLLLLKPAILCGLMGAIAGLILTLINRSMLKWLRKLPESPDDMV